MPKTMLIDATHAEETRVAVVDGNRLVEFDYESKVRKQLKGGIFLAKVTRVEPSLQAAFVNFGGNRHGFLPFSEIHPDYFRIPVADREALLAAQIAELEEHDEEMQAAEEDGEDDDTTVSENGDEDDEDDEDDVIVEVGGEDQPLVDDEEDAADAVMASVSDDEAEASKARPAKKAPRKGRSAMKTADADAIEGPAIEVIEEDIAEDATTEDEAALAQDARARHGDSHEDSEVEGFDAENALDEDSSDESDEAEGDDEDSESAELSGDAENGRRGNGHRGRGRGRGRGHSGHGGGRGRGRGRGRPNDDMSVDSLGGDSAEGDRPFRYNLRKSYKIQEVIKRGQIMLIQVSKEERGNKGAAVTTYLSLPGRYCVLMPNSPRGGGVSRKIASFKDRKRMKEILDDLSVPEGMSVILRTAGLARTKVEIKRDLDYLTRLWNTIREHTLKSSAPALIYEEGNLIKRAIRDLYSRDIEDVHVAGEDGYKAAKEFMKMLMPSHAKKVQEYKDERIPLFHKFGVESQIADIGEPTVSLKSGGYLVINPTEALVSIDVNSGRATKERHIEETALKTNLEAADELARQLRLRDLGGLVVVDFIDMEDRRNNRKVEQRLRDALSSDRARIQVGRISSFGLLELSRQRLNPSLAEAQTEVCEHCAGTGRVRTLDFSAISIIRALEAEGIKGKATHITLTVGTAVALYLLNHKRSQLSDLEARYGYAIEITTDEALSNTHFSLDSVTRAVTKPFADGTAPITSVNSFDEDEGDEGAENTASHNVSAKGDDDSDGEDGLRRRRRGRRGGRGRRGRGNQGDDNADHQQEGEADSQSSNDEETGAESRGDERPRHASPQEGEEAEGEKKSRPRRSRGGRGRGKNRGDGDNAQDQSSEAQEPQSRGESGSDFAAPVAALVEPVASVEETSSPAKAVPAASNDAAPARVERDYETVNATPEKKKKGWWNKLVE